MGHEGSERDQKEVGTVLVARLGDYCRAGVRHLACRQPDLLFLQLNHVPHSGCLRSDLDWLGHVLYATVLCSLQKKVRKKKLKI